MAKNLAELCSCFRILWKVEIVSNEVTYLAEAISKPSVEEVWVLQTAYSKKSEKQKWLKHGIVN